MGGLYYLAILKKKWIQTSVGTSPWTRFGLRVPSYDSKDPGPKPLDPGTRVQKNESSVEKITGIGGVLSGLVGLVMLRPGT